MISELALMTALYERLGTQTAAVALFGEPPAIQQTPLLYLTSYQSDYEPVTFTQYRALLKPRIRIVVSWQQPPTAETQLLTLVDQIVTLVTVEPLDAAYWCSVDQLLYGYLTVGGTRYRMAQLALDVAQYQEPGDVYGNRKNPRR
jgi:hypothetical protein